MDETDVVAAARSYPDVPDGWRRVICRRQTGRTVGKQDIYYYPPGEWTAAVKAAAKGPALRSYPDTTRFMAGVANTSSWPADVTVHSFSFASAENPPLPTGVQKFVTNP